MSNVITRFFRRLFGSADVRGPGSATPNDTRARDNMLPRYREDETRDQTRRRALDALNDAENRKRNR